MKRTLRILIYLTTAGPLLAQNAAITSPPQPVTLINAGAHMTYVVSATGGAPLKYQWAFNGTNIIGATNTTYSLTNLTVASNGTYAVTVTASNLTTATASGTLTVYLGAIPLATTNLVLLRVGDGIANANSVTTGNTLYVDQYTTNGTYVSTLMIPDTGTGTSGGSAPLVGYQTSVENYMTASANNLYLNFAGYNLQRPAVSNINISSATAMQAPRGIGAVSGLGYYTLAVSDTNALWNGLRPLDVVSSDGLSNFWAAANSSAGVVFVQPGQPDVTIQTVIGNGSAHEMGIYGGQLYFGTSTAANGHSQGLYYWFPPYPTNVTTAVSPSLTPTITNPNDFSISPDGNTLYVNCGSLISNLTQTAAGGVQRWDNDGGGFAFSYTITNLPNFLGTGNNGPDGLAVDWSQFSGGGSAATGAVIYVTTGENPTTKDRVAQIVDTGQASTAQVIITSPSANVAFRGIRFGPASQAASIVSQPGSRSAVLGSTVTLPVVVAGSQLLTDQWFLDGTNLSNGGNVFGANTATLTITNFGANNVGSYLFVVSNTLAAQTSSIIALTISTNDPDIAIPPQNTNANFGATASFSVTPFGTAPFSYSWLANGSPLSDGPTGSGSTISGSHLSTLVIANVSCADSASTYSVIVSNRLGTVTSSSASLAVADPVVSVQATNRTALIGGSTTFSVAAAGSGSLTYSWLHGATFLADGLDISGATISGSSSPTLTISGITAAAAGNYSARVSGGCNIVISAPATLTAVQTPVQSWNVTVGANVGFVVASSGGAPTYQWAFNGTGIPGATGVSILVTNVQVANAGTYTVTVTSGDVVSLGGTLSVSTTLLPLYPTNIMVLRAGDGSVPLANTGNTFALDQFTTSGTYVSSVVLPTSGPKALLGYSGIVQNYMTRSVNNLYLNFMGYNTTLPFTSDLGAATAVAAPRGIGAVSGTGFFTLAVSDTNDFGGVPVVDVASTDGLTNFWVTGGGGGLRYIRPNQPTVVIESSTGGGNNHEVEILNGNIYIDTGSGNTQAVFEVSGTPTNAAVPTLLFLNPPPNDMALSPDGLTLYMNNGGNLPTGAGGTQRWDMTNGLWSLSYTITNVPWTGGGNNGPDGIEVDFSQFTGGGASGTGAVLYTTSGASTQDQLSRIVDVGPTSIAVVLATAGPNQAYRGVRFAPATAAASTSPAFTAIAGRSNGGAVLTYTGPAGYNYRLWASTNLTLRPIPTTWTQLTNSFFNGSPATFTDSQAINSRSRFYILSLP